MAKQIVEVTRSLEDNELKGLTSTLTFSGGVKVDLGLEGEQVRHEVDICSNNVSMGTDRPEQYETMVFVGDHKSSIYCQRVEKEEDMPAMHFKAVTHFKQMYWDQQGKTD
jgi:hypothetical protein